MRSSPSLPPCSTGANPRCLADPDEADTLFLDVAVIRGSEPHEEIFICTGCRQREHKRAQRKKEARVRPANEASEVSSPDEDEERRKVVIFNCSEYVEFGAGEVVLPTRITCYCRHHKERLGFSCALSLDSKDHLLTLLNAASPSPSAPQPAPSSPLVPLLPS